MDAREFSAYGADQGEECFYCGGSGYHFIGSIDEHGEEREASYRCRRCAEEAR